MESKYYCSDCKCSFVRKYILNQHKKSTKHLKRADHNNTLFSCVCGKSYSDKKCLVYHMKTSDCKPHSNISSISTENKVEVLSERLNIYEKKQHEMKAQISMLMDAAAGQTIYMSNNNHNNIEEECKQLKSQLEQKNDEIITETRKIREITLLEQFPKNVQCVYYGTIDNMSDKNEQLIKFGNSNNLKNRVVKHKETYSNFRLMNAFKVENKLQIENALKENPVFIERQCNLILKGKKYIELLNINGLTFAEIDKIIKDIIMNIEYSPENYNKIVEENNKLRKQLDERNE